MTEQWQYQLRIDVAEGAGDAARRPDVRPWRP